MTCFYLKATIRLYYERYLRKWLNRQMLMGGGMGITCLCLSVEFNVTPISKQRIMKYGKLKSLKVSFTRKLAGSHTFLSGQGHPRRRRPKPRSPRARQRQREENHRFDHPSPRPHLGKSYCKSVSPQFLLKGNIFSCSHLYTFFNLLV